MKKIAAILTIAVLALHGIVFAADTNGAIRQIRTMVFRLVHDLDPLDSGWRDGVQIDGQFQRQNRL